MTWNTVRGCTKITPGCAACYASTFAERFRGVPGHPYEQGFDLRLVPEKLTEPLRWRKSRMVFVNSMSDLFHGHVPELYIAKVWQTMAAADWHTYQILTKRAKRMGRWVREWCDYGRRDPMPHVWLGVSVENRQHGLPRIEELRRTPAAVRFLSVEPLLEGLGKLDLTGIDWVIVGGESGRTERRMHVEWVERIQAQCLDQGVRFFFKQWGEFKPFYLPVEGEYFYERVGKKKAGRRLGGRTWDDMPPIERAEYPGRVEARRRLAVLQ